MAILDVHNYARVNTDPNATGNIIGQGGPSSTAFAALWKKLAADWANNPNIVRLPLAGQDLLRSGSVS